MLFSGRLRRPMLPLSPSRLPHNFPAGSAIQYCRPCLSKPPISHYRSLITYLSLPISHLILSYLHPLPPSPALIYPGWNRPCAKVAFLLTTPKSRARNRLFGSRGATAKAYGAQRPPFCAQPRNPVHKTASSAHEGQLRRPAVRKSRLSAHDLEIPCAKPPLLLTGCHCEGLRCAKVAFLRTTPKSRAQNRLFCSRVIMRVFLQVFSGEERKIKREPLPSNPLFGASHCLVRKGKANETKFKL